MFVIVVGFVIALVCCLLLACVILCIAVAGLLWFELLLGLVWDFAVFFVVALLLLNTVAYVGDAAVGWVCFFVYCVVMIGSVWCALLWLLVAG